MTGPASTMILRTQPALQTPLEGRRPVSPGALVRPEQTLTQLVGRPSGLDLSQVRLQAALDDLGLVDAQLPAGFGESFLKLLSKSDRDGHMVSRRRRSPAKCITVSQQHARAPPPA